MLTMSLVLSRAPFGSPRALRMYNSWLEHSSSNLSLVGHHICWLCWVDEGREQTPVVSKSCMSHWKGNFFQKHHCSDNSVLPFLPQLLCTLLSSLTWNFVCLLLQTLNILRTLLLPSYLVTYMAQLFVLLGEKAGKILGFLRLKSRGLLLSVLRRKLELSQAQRSHLRVKIKQWVPWQSRSASVTAAAAQQREGNSLKKKPTQDWVSTYSDHRSCFQSVDCLNMERMTAASFSSTLLPPYLSQLRGISSFFIRTKHSTSTSDSFCSPLLIFDFK